METISSLSGASVDSALDSSMASDRISTTTVSKDLVDHPQKSFPSSESGVGESTNTTKRVDDDGSSESENLPPIADDSTSSLSLVAVRSNLEISLTTPPRPSSANVSVDDGISDGPGCDRPNLVSDVSVSTVLASGTSGIIMGGSRNGSLLQNSTSGGLCVTVTSPSLPQTLPHANASSPLDAGALTSPGAGTDVQISHQSLSKRRRGSNSDNFPAVKKEKPDDGYENAVSGNFRSGPSVSAAVGSNQSFSRATSERESMTAPPKKGQRVRRQSNVTVAGVTNALFRPGTNVRIFPNSVRVSVPSAGLQRTILQPTGKKNAALKIAPAPQFARPPGSVRGPGVTPTSSFVPPGSTVPTAQSSFRRTLIRLSTPQTFRGRSLHVHVTRKVKSLAGRNAIDRYVAVKEPPSELHVGVPRRYVCPACGDEFITNSGMTDHLSRRTMVLAFRCLCSSATWPRNFYNPCTLVAFYQAHRRGPGVHAPCDSYIASVLADNTAEYTECLKERDRQLSADVLAAAEAAAAEAVDTSAPVSETRPVAARDVLPSVIITSDGCKGTTEKRQISNVPSPKTINGKLGQLDDKDSADAEMEKFFDCLCRYGTECVECKVTHESRSALAAHFAHSRPNCAVLTCGTCDANLQNKCRFDAHQRLHEQQRPCICPECGVHFDDAVPFDVFKRHVELACFHILRSAPRFDRCVRCNVVLHETGETQMADHLVEAHATTYHKCSGCPMAFSNAEAAQRHSTETKHDAQHRVVHKCPSCDAVFDGGNTAKMRSHVIGHFNSLTFHCPICDMRVNRRSRMAEHLRAAHASETACLNICEVCGLVCVTKVELYEHVKSMHGAFFETVLKAVAPTGIKDGLEVENTDGKGSELGTRLECSRCQMQFTSEELHRRHLAKHRFVEEKQTVKKRRSKEDLTVLSDNHADIEVTVRLHVCTKCRQEFKTSAELDNHWSTAHPAPTWHACHLCADAFHSADDLQQHLAARHSGKAAARSTGSILCLLCAEKSEPGSPPLRCFAHQGLLTKHLHAVHGIAREDATRRAREMTIASLSKSNAEREDETASNADEKPATSTSAKRLFVNGESASYQCALCEFVVDARAEFVEHLAQKHQPTVAGAVQCKECGSCFAVVPALHRHLRIVHRIVCNIATYVAVNGISVATESEPVLPLPAVLSESVSALSPTASDSSSSVGSGSFTSGKSRSSVPSVGADGVEDGAQECTVCYRKFGSVSLLRCHMRVHGMAFIQGTRRRLSSVQTDAS